MSSIPSQLKSKAIINQVQVYRIEGSSQYVVSDGQGQYSFLSEEDANRFAAQISSVKTPFQAKPIETITEKGIPASFPANVF